MRKAHKWIDKHPDQIERLAAESMTSDDYVRYMIISLAAAIGLGVLSLFVPFLWFFASIAFVALAVFFILWLIEYA